ncbi:hypothetical protein Hanom_Chr17g01587741 [Helianthus anomalus]
MTHYLFCQKICKEIEQRAVWTRLTAPWFWERINLIISSIQKSHCASCNLFFRWTYLQNSYYIWSFNQGGVNLGSTNMISLTVFTHDC